MPGIAMSANRPNPQVKVRPAPKHAWHHNHGKTVASQSWKNSGITIMEKQCFRSCRNRKHFLQKGFMAVEVVSNKDDSIIG